MIRRWLEHRYLPWYLAVLAMVLCSPALRSGWQLDDHFHRAALTRPDLPECTRTPAELFAFIKGDEAIIHEHVAAGLLPWWTSERLRLAFFRPVTGYTHWLDYQLWPDLPLMMHLQSLLWLGAAVAAAAFFYRRMIPIPWIAGLAALLFAVEDAHGMPAAWIANRNALIGLLFGLLTLYLHDRWRRDGRRMGAYLAPVSLLLGLLSNEGAAATGGYLLAYAVFIDRGTRMERMRSLLPCALTGVLWWITYRYLGYGAAASGLYIDPGADPGLFAKMVLIRAPILLFGQLGFPADLGYLMSEAAGRLLLMSAVGFLVIMAILLHRLLRQDPTARFWFMGMLLSTLPVCAVYPSNRLLFFVGIGGMGLLAQFMASALENTGSLTWKLPARALCFVFIFLHLVIAPFTLTRSAKYVRQAGELMESWEMAGISSDVPNRKFVTINTPSFAVNAYGYLGHLLKSDASPVQGYVLGSGCHPKEVLRLDSRTLRIRVEGGFLADLGTPFPGEQDQPIDIRNMYRLFDRIYRARQPMKTGERIELNDLVVEVGTVSSDGRPVEVDFRFTCPLEDPSLHWLQWMDGTFVPFPVPEVGQTVNLPGFTVPFSLSL